MKPQQNTIYVHMEGQDDAIVVKADQRDFAAFEATDMYDGLQRGHTMVRYYAWHAMKRSRLTQLPFEAWNAKCIQAAMPAETDSEDEQSDDPR